MTATAVNPVLYSWMNHSFRSEFIRVLPCLSWIFCGLAMQSENLNKINNNRRMRIITDCAPALNRRNCGDAIRDRRLTLNTYNGVDEKTNSVGSRLNNGSLRNPKNDKLLKSTLSFNSKAKHKSELESLLNGDDIIQVLKHSKKYSLNCGNQIVVNLQQY